jgi:NAD(P) transhydrogenase subunit alpha
MKLGVPKEIWPGENRVALVPESCKKLSGAGVEILIQSGAGANAFVDDDAYAGAGAKILADAQTLYREADFILKVQPPLVVPGEVNEVELMRPGSMLLATLMPTRHLNVVRELAARQITAFATDAIPRTTRAQAMDVLSSMANISGYKGVLLAALELPKYFPMFMTAAGTVFPAKVFVIGAGVAGLQAIATAKRLGAALTATDVRPEVKEQIESVGARYVGIELKESAAAGGGYAKELSEDDKRKQQELLVEQLKLSDVVITTALIRGVLAPKLISAEMVRSMRRGSLIVDLAADGGGNCELSRPGETVIENGVKIIAPLNLPSTMPVHASTLYSRNLTAFVMAFWEENQFKLDWNDEILGQAVITHGGEVRHGLTKEALAKG